MENQVFQFSSYKLARWNKFVEYMIDNTSCDLTRVFGDLWSFVMFRKFCTSRGRAINNEMY